jgi:hypothetical protein
MKHVPLIVLMVLVVAACNLTNKFKSGDSSNSNSNSNSSSTSSSSNPTKIGDDPVEKPEPNAAQTAALANGETVKWDQQGMTWTFPPNWKKQDVRNESFNYSGDGAFLTVSISVMPQMEKLTDVSSKAMFEGAKTQQKIGKYDEVKWLELDGMRGVGFRESKQEMPGDIRRLEWQAYRTYAGNTQLVTMILSTDSGNFAKHQDELYAILFSTKLVK